MSEQNVQVTQADREAAAEFGIGHGYVDGVDYSAGYMIRNGHWDHKPIVQAFARHRTRAEPDLVAAALPITPAMIDRAAAAFDEARWNEDARTGVDAVRPAIEAALRAALEGDRDELATD